VRPQGTHQVRDRRVLRKHPEDGRLANVGKRLLQLPGQLRVGTDYDAAKNVTHSFASLIYQSMELIVLEQSFDSLYSRR
jgi:hypothetical protein